MQDLDTAPFLDIFYDPDDQILYADWKGYQSFDTGTAGCGRILECVAKYQVSKILNDNTYVRGLWMDAAELAARIWFPRLKQAGMRRFAWVYSPAKFSRISTDAALAAMDPEAFGVEVFFTREDTVAWLRSEP
jgi:hypothetical protein